MPFLGRMLLLLAILIPVIGAQPADRTRNPHGTLTVSCESCHTATAWKPIRPHPEFNHDTQTKYPLRGMHAGVTCQSCHINQVFKKAAHDCASCHADLHRAQMGNQCAQCHTVQGWTPVRKMGPLDHSNRFPLLGAHATVNCESCHRGAANAVFVGMSTECISCHRSDFVAARNPSHQQNNFPLNCAQCHSMNSWAGAKFDHSFVFPLVGAHATLACTQCHVNNNFAIASRTCAGCHLADYNKTTNPNHIQAAFPTDCALCHSSLSWSGASFNHALSSFPLTGAHVSAACAQCHVNNNFTSVPRVCNGCHMPDFNKTTNPNHVQAAFPTDCAQCHSTINWSGASFNHALSGFPLTGAHVTVACAQCHVNNNFTSVPRVCNGCHMPDFNKTTNPNHVQAAFPTDCALCHSTIKWSGATFNHALTIFPLTGAHITTPCAQCHVNNNFTSVPSTCDGCHLPEYKQTTNPNHSSAGFPLNCAVCHSTTNWTSATFDHSKTVFPLTGAHISTPCASCHVGNNYKTVPTDCYSCHKTDFTGVQNPNHLTSGFPTACAQCHATSTWAGATFNHTWFPIYSGTHARVWTSCADCHLDSSNYKTFSCTNCHTHTKAATDPRHNGVRGYTYAPTSCYQCHASGGGR